MALAALLVPVGGLAHDSPEHVIETLTRRIEIRGRQPDLLWQRATEHRALGQTPAALDDLRQALQADPNFLPALTDLGRLRLAQGKSRLALRLIDRALLLAGSDAERAPLRMLRAEILAERGQDARALEEADAAIRAAPSLEPEWYLTRSRLQRRLGRPLEAVASLRAGTERTGSGVLECECLDAMIDAGLFDEARPGIASHLADSRWRSSWWVRRARIRLATGEISAAHEDLLAAIHELNDRLSGPLVDGELLAERGLAHALLGDQPLAKRDLARARKLGADGVAVERLVRALRSGS